MKRKPGRLSKALAKAKLVLFHDHDSFLSACTCAAQFLTLIVDYSSTRLCLDVVKLGWEDEPQQNAVNTRTRRNGNARQRGHSQGPKTCIQIQDKNDDLK